MINRKIHIITLFFFISLSILKGGDAPWTCSVSNNYHTIYIADISNLYVQTEPLDTGDYIGVFYEEKPGQLVCGGYYQLSNLKDTVKILAYGDDSVNSGFAPGDSFIFKIYKKKEDCFIENIEPQYSYSYQAYYAVGGESYITQMYVYDEPYVYYPQTHYCKSDGKVTPVAENAYSIRYESDSALSIDAKTGVIDLQKSDSGHHDIYLITSQCLMNDKLNIYVYPETDLIKARDTLICRGDRTALQAKSGMISYHWSTGSTEDYILASDDTLYTLKAKDNNGCFLHDSIDVGYHTLDSNIGHYKENTCSSVIVKGNDPELEYWWSDGTMNGWDSVKNSIEVTSSRNVYLSVQDTFGCLYNDTLYVKVDTLNVSGLYFTTEDATCNDKGKVIIDTSSLSGGKKPYQYIFYGSDLLLDENSYSPEIKLAEGTYQFSIQDQAGCSKTISSNVTIKKPDNCDYPVFTPDGDGIDDYYYINKSGTARIYDRYGRLVMDDFKVPSYWDGSDDSGNPLPIGSYVIVCNENTYINITIIK